MRLKVKLLLLHSTFSNLNLFLSKQEMERLLGLEKELYYVRDDTVNKYAMGFVIPVRSSVASLHFTWYNTVSNSLNYSLTTSSSHPLALPIPSVNISMQGIVPEQPQVWHAVLQCTGTEDAEVAIALDLSITGLDVASSPQNTTKLRFRRKKTCFMTANQVEAMKNDNVPV